jgi:hypothetical protein
MDAAHGPSRHFDAAQQPRRFGSKADINFGASSYRVYEYTAWLSRRARIVPHTWEIRTALLDGIEEFLTGIRPVPSRIELWQQFFSPMSSILRSRQHRKWGELLQQHHVLGRRSWRGSVAGRRTRRGIVSRSLVMDAAGPIRCGMSISRQVRSLGIDTVSRPSSRNSLSEGARVDENFSIEICVRTPLAAARECAGIRHKPNELTPV